MGGAGLSLGGLGIWLGWVGLGGWLVGWLVGVLCNSVGIVDIVDI